MNDTFFKMEEFYVMCKLYLNKVAFKMVKEFEQMVYKRQRIANKNMKRYVHQLYLNF